MCWSYEELIAALDNLTIESVTNMKKTIFSTFFIEAFVHGNVSKQGALSFCDLIENKLIGHYKSIPLANHSNTNLREIVLEPGTFHRYETVIDIQKPKAINAYFQVSFDDLEEASKLQLVNQMISEPFFDILRTKEQLGYVTYSRVQTSSGVR